MLSFPTTSRSERPLNGHRRPMGPARSEAPVQSVSSSMNCARTTSRFGCCRGAGWPRRLHNWSEIRTRLIRHRSKMETADDCFPRIEAVRDNVGNTFLQSRGGRSKVALHVGDGIDFVVTASDPLGGKLLYGMTLHGHHGIPDQWQEQSSFRWTVTTVARGYSVYFWIKSEREHHAHPGLYGHAKLASDDILHTHYDVLPTKLAAAS